METRVVNVIRKTMIVFFAIVFITGFFSKSIINLFLPKVQAMGPTQGFVYKVLDIEGTIEPKGTLKVRLGADVIVEEYFVQKGDPVKAGDPIFRINNSYAIDSSGNEIESLKVDLQREESRLERLNGSSYTVDVNKKEALIEKINKEKEELINFEKLYNAGAVSQSEIEIKREAIRNLERDLDSTNALLNEKISNASIEIKEVLNNIEEIKAKIELYSTRDKFYSSVDKDGIYYSEVEGIAYEINATDLILRKDAVIAEIAEVVDHTSLKFVAYVPEKEYDFVKDGGNLEVQFDTFDRPLTIRIIRVSEILENGQVRIEGIITENARRLPTIGERIIGTKRAKILGAFNVPKASVIPVEELEIGKDAYVYVVDEKEGVLGTEYVVVRVRAMITAIGDKKVSLDNLGGVEDPKVVTNLSYKIRDGARVFLWK